jgi:hypothetical protein
MHRSMRVLLLLVAGCGGTDSMMSHEPSSVPDAASPDAGVKHADAGDAEPDASAPLDGGPPDADAEREHDGGAEQNDGGPRQDAGELDGAASDGAAPDACATGGEGCNTRDDCLDVACDAGLACIDDPGPGTYRCIDPDGCSDVDCGPGARCEDLQAPELGYRCIDIDACAGATCDEGLTCYDEPAPSLGHGCIDPFDLLYKWLPADDRYETRAELSVASEDIAALVQGWGDEGFVVTAAFADYSTYALIAYRPARTELQRPFDTRLVITDYWGVDAEVASLGAEGFLVTAAIEDTSEFVIGTRPRGSLVRFETSVPHPNGASLNDKIDALAASGYFLSATTCGTNGFQLYGARTRGSSLQYELRATQVVDGSLDRRAIHDVMTGFAHDGFVLAAANTLRGTLLFTHFGSRPIGMVRPYRGGSGPFSTADDISNEGNGGFIVMGGGVDGLHNQLLWSINRP